MTATNFDVVATSLSTLTTVKANAATADVAIADFMKNNTNTGSSGTIVLTLPTAASTKGQVSRVFVSVAQIVRLLPQTGEAIYLAGSGVVTKYLNIAAVIGNYVEIYSDGASYFVTASNGVVTKEA